MHIHAAMQQHALFIVEFQYVYTRCIQYIKYKPILFDNIISGGGREFEENIWLAVLTISTVPGSKLLFSNTYLAILPGNFCV